MEVENYAECKHPGISMRSALFDRSSANVTIFTSEMAANNTTTKVETSSLFKRKENWTDEEVSTLVEAVRTNKLILLGSFSQEVTKQKRQATWERIAQQVSAVSVGGQRSGKDARKKWQTLTSATKRKEVTRKTEQRRTGGGALPSQCVLNTVEEGILSCIPKALVEGIQGGMDTDDIADEFHDVLDMSNTSLNIGSLDIEYVSPPIIASCSSSHVGHVEAQVVHAVQSANKKDKHKDKRDSFEEQLLDIEREKLDEQKKQTIALQRIQEILQNLSNEKAKDIFNSHYFG